MAEAQVAEKQNSQNKVVPVLVVVLVAAAFLLGSLWTKIGMMEEKDKDEGAIAGQQAGETTPVPTRPPFSPKKTDKPEVKFFVMSYCPFGTQAEQGLEPVYQLLKDKVVWQPRFVIYTDYCSRAPEDQRADCEEKYCLKQGGNTYCSMHGIAELNQDLREVCAYQSGNWDQWWQFASGINDNCKLEEVETCWQGQAQKAGLNVSEIENCFEQNKFAFSQKETEEMEKYGVRGSPSVFINDVSYNGGRAPEDYKQAICNSFANPPKECETVLGTQSSGAAGGC